MGYDNVCNTGLVLGLGLESTTTTDINPSPRPRPKLPIISFEPSLTLALISGHERKIVFKAADDHQDSSSGANSSFSNPSLKREREGAAGSEEPESTEILVSAAAATRVISDDFEDEDDNNNNINSRKKLRLTKPQSALLEENFKHHTTLNPKQKQELARNLNLSPRQVEVWFQNRRARTKLKQTEVEHEYLKKCCETLTDENRRLQKELQELKALKLMQPPLYMQLPAATLTLCPSCETIGGPTDKSSKSPFVSKPHHHFYNPFTTHPSAAC